MLREQQCTTTSCEEVKYFQNKMAAKKEVCRSKPASGIVLSALLNIAFLCIAYINWQGFKLVTIFPSKRIGITIMDEA